MSLAHGADDAGAIGIVVTWLSYIASAWAQKSASR